MIFSFILNGKNNMEMNIKHSDIATAFIVIISLLFISPMLPTLVSQAITFTTNLFAGTGFNEIFEGGLIVLGLVSFLILNVLITIFQPKNL